MNEKKAKQLRRKVYKDQSLRTERTYKLVVHEDSVGTKRKRLVVQGLRGTYLRSKQLERLLK